MLQYGCEDGNLVNGDGCSSACAIETGYNCLGGTAAGKDTCYELCGDGKDFAKLGCEDGD